MMPSVNQPAPDMGSPFVWSYPGSARRATCAIRAHRTLQGGEFHHLVWVKDSLGQAGAEPVCQPPIASWPGQFRVGRVRWNQRDRVCGFGVEKSGGHRCGNVAVAEWL